MVLFVVLGHTRTTSTTTATTASSTAAISTTHVTTTHVTATVFTTTGSYPTGRMNCSDQLSLKGLLYFFRFIDWLVGY